MLMANKPCIYFFTFYAAGHLMSMVEFAKRLSSFGNSFSINFFVLMEPDEHNQLGSPLCSSYLRSLQAQNTPFQFHRLPSVEPPTSFDGIPELVNFYVRSYLPHIKAQLLASPSPISALVLDIFCSDVIDVANELNIPSYIYYTSTATSLTLMSYLSCQEENNMKDFSEVENINVPGLIPIPSTCCLNDFINRNSSFYKGLMHNGRRSNEAKAVIVNSSIYLEKTTMKALAEGTLQLAPDTKISNVYPIGPVISLGKNSSKEQECLKWLDRQPMKSVVFLCFGSMGAFDVSQSRQIASALDQSGLRFLWAILTPSNELVGYPIDGNLDELLPEGFIERTKERGLVWPSLVPQTDILSHEAIGGFVTHCGWNSCLESLWFGVPMVAWPLYFSDQHLNAFQLVNEMHVAIALEIDRKKGFVSAKELERAIKCLMDEGSEEGRIVRKKAGEIKLACREAVEVGGVSYVHLQNLAIELGWKEVHNQST